MPCMHACCRLHGMHANGEKTHESRSRSLTTFISHAMHGVCMPCTQQHACSMLAFSCIQQHACRYRLLCMACTQPPACAHAAGMPSRHALCMYAGPAQRGRDKCYTRTVRGRWRRLAAMALRRLGPGPTSDVRRQNCAASQPAWPPNPGRLALCCGRCGRCGRGVRGASAGGVHRRVALFC